MSKKIDVTVKVGTIKDADGEHPPGTHLSMSNEDAAGLISSGVLVEGKVDFDKPAEVGEQSTQQVTINVDQKRLAVFSKAIGVLEIDNEKHWTQDDKPDVAALKALGVETTASERDAVWEVLGPLLG